jgi:hypothetical protein
VTAITTTVTRCNGPRCNSTDEGEHPPAGTLVTLRPANTWAKLYRGSGFGARDRNGMRLGNTPGTLDFCCSECLVAWAAETAHR